MVSSLASLAVPYFSTLSHNLLVFRKNFTERKVSGKFLILRRTERDIKHASLSSSTVLVTLVGILSTDLPTIILYEVSQKSVQW